MNVIDTNIWIYLHDGRDPRKRQVAQELVASVRPIVLPWQVGCEFIAAARKLEPFGFNLDEAWEALADMQAGAERVLLPKPSLWARCRDLQRQHQLQFWDALIIAQCVDDKVARLYSEDLPGINGIDGLEILNPFL
jgi:predicted nucleic acid-binding protein